MKQIKTVDAVGKILVHDITKIVPGEFKGVAFKKGHVIKEEDVKELLSLGKDHIYILDDIVDGVHENDAANTIIETICGENLEFSDVHEGKIDIIAKVDGMLKINVDLLYKVNSLGEIAIATLHTNMPIKRGKKIAGTRIIPLYIKKEKLEEMKKIVGNEKLIEIIPYNKYKVGIVTTGNEVFYERIKDRFGPVIVKKFENYGSEILGQIICKDDKEDIKEAIKVHIENGANLVVTTGGMSVDPDDITPSAIKEVATEFISYGSPVLPGSMFLVSYYNKIPILGLPGCVMSNKATVFDIVLPRILAGEKIEKSYIDSLGHGGLCEACEVCVFPHCNFGKNGL